MLQQFGGNLLSAVAFSSLHEWQVCADECRMRIWCSCSRLHVSCNSCCHSWVWVHVRQYHPVIRSSPKNDHRQHCHVGNAGPALSTGLIPRLRLCWRGHTMWKDMLKDHDIQFEESGHPVYRASSALDRGFLKDSWTRKVGDVRFTSVRILRTQSFLSHNQFCKSAQYLRSNRGLVLWIDSADSWAVIIFKHGVIHREWASSYVEKLEEVSTYKWDEWSSSDWSTARSSQISELAGFMRKVSLECFRTTLMLIMDLEEQPGHAESTRLRHRENEHRQNWRSNSFDFEREGARTFADSQWLGHIYRGCNLLYVRTIPRSLGKAQDAKGLMRGVSVASCFSVMSWFRVFLPGQTFGTGWEKVPNWECLVVHRKQGLFSSVHVDDIRVTGRQQNVRPMWKKLMKNVDLGDATSFLDHVYLGCTQRECKPNENIIEEYTKMFESHISAGATEKWLGWEKLHGTSVAWSYDMDGQKHGESL